MRLPLGQESIAPIPADQRIEIERTEAEIRSDVTSAYNSGMSEAEIRARIPEMDPSKPLGYYLISGGQYVPQGNDVLDTFKPTTDPIGKTVQRVLLVGGVAIAAFFLLK